MSENELIEKFIKTIDAKPGNTKKLFAIGFIGLNGVGKSFVAQKISERLGLYIASNDKIRRFLNEQGFEGVSPVQELLQEIAETSSKFLYKNKMSHILDADLIQFHGVAKKNASENSALFYIVHLTCPEQVILERLEKREKEILNDPDSNLSRVGKERYFERKKMHESLLLPEIFFIIDTSRDIEGQLDGLVSKLEKEQVI